MDKVVYRRELTPLDFLRRSAFIFPEKIAVVHGERRYNYAQFQNRANRLAAALVESGLKPGERVAFLCPNIPPLLEAHFGVPMAGGVLVAINIRLSSDEIRYILQHSGARFLFADAELANVTASIQLPDLQVIRIDDTGLPGDPYEDFLSAATERLELNDTLPYDEEDLISLNYTSGTTGRPKGVMYTYRATYLQAMGNVLEMQLGYDNSVFLWTLPLFHCNGWCFPWAVTAVAGRHVCLRKADPALIWDLIDREQVTHYCAAPTIQLGIVNHPKAHRTRQVVRAGTGGASPSLPLLKRLAELNFLPVHLYGLTEVYGPNVVCLPQPHWQELSFEEQARLLARQGQAYIPTDLVRVVDAEMKDVPKDGQTMGEVIMRGNTVMKGYFRQPEATAEAFRGGWFHSGDLAVWYADGYLELRDRQKDIIISGGENISTIEVEQVINQYPAVLECAIIAIPDEKWGERPKAFVTLKAGQKATEAELIEFCRQHLAHYKCPVAVSFGEMPKTATGKIQKFVLREQEWAGRAKRVN